MQFYNQPSDDTEIEAQISTVGNLDEDMDENCDSGTISTNEAQGWRSKNPLHYIRTYWRHSLVLLPKLGRCL